MGKQNAPELRKFLAPEFLFGIGARYQAGRYARNLGSSRVLLVSDPGVIAAGWTSQVRNSLEEEGLETVLFSGLTPNPKALEVTRGVEIYLQADCDTIVAVGGGSPIDCAKGIAVVTANGGSILDYEGVDMISEPGPPLLCIPTTAGTAADLSQFAIITDQARRCKIAIISKAIVPDLSLIDPEMTTTMDPFLTACTGMDALTHAIEAAVSNAHSPITDLHALKAVELICGHIERVVAFPGDLDARAQMMLGCLEAGLAFSNASLGAVHAMAHSLGGYLDLPHGECNAILLRQVMEFNMPAADDQFSLILKAMGIETRQRSRREMAASILAEIERLRRAVGIHQTLHDLGVHRTDVRELAESAERDPCLATNPRAINRRDLEVLYEESL
ncbi:alcohol dehydrogenase-like regulatory protein ErcA [Desulfuromonas sp. TF]|uniref:alcohol dehydrogenase-like regulatory protein ErcA n=1 Tax=Desulfuromonas sp. TF TaxID=1232410 RepID=UPI0004099804|nr:alcohol dehydrogenase-like regulatory protein ErcA [Desulfuromonas sp. TF]